MGRGPREAAPKSCALRRVWLGAGVICIALALMACGKNEASTPSGPTLMDITPDGPDASTDVPSQPADPEAPGEPGPDTTLPGTPPSYRSVSAFDAEGREPSARIEGARGLGGSCATTAECQPGLGCANVIYSGVAESNIAGGYCSRWCEQDADCEDLDGGGFCAADYLGSDLSFCTRKCLTGESSELKCNGRTDLSCGGFPGIEASCLPRCSADSDCGVGRCSGVYGICDATLTALARAVIGGRCRTSQPASCNGICSAIASGSDEGVCTGYCRLGSTCGEGQGNVCAPRQFGLREGDTGMCEQRCVTPQDCTEGLTVCAPTGFLLDTGELQHGCAPSYAAPRSLAPQRLSLTALQLATLPASVINVSTISIWEAVSHRLYVEDGAVCVSGEAMGELGGLLELDFQFAPNNGALFDASAASAFVFDAEGGGVVRFDAYGPTRFYRLLTPEHAAADLGEGRQRVRFDELVDIFSPDDAPFDPTRLAAVRFTLPFEYNPGPFRFCVSQLALEPGSSAPDAGG